MKKIFAICLAGALLTPVLVRADPVDLRGKRGVVDPRDLKRFDPKERSLHIKEPPAPERERPSGGQPQSPPNGSLQGPNNAAPIRVAPIRPARPGAR